VIVLDASAGIAALLRAGTARATMAVESLHAPHLIDAEVANVLRRKVLAGEIASDAGWASLDAWRHLGLRRYPLLGGLQRVWELRGTVCAYDACYVALAEMLDCPLITADARLARAPRIRCAVTVVPG